MGAPAAVDDREWLEAIGKDPELTTRDLMAGYYYTDAAETDLTDDQLGESFGRLFARGYFSEILVLDKQASFDVRKTIPKANR
jgi:hypothetical protein